MSLFHQPQTLADLTQPVTTGDVPGPISRLAFASDIQTYRARSLQAGGETPDGGNSILQSLYYGPDRSVCVILDGKPVPLHAVVGADLSQWRSPSHQGYREGELLVAIDVALGRLLFLERDMLTSKSVVEVNYSYGFSADLGGGPYARDLPSEAIQDQRINVLKGGKVDTLQKALVQWEKLCSDWTAQHSQGSTEVLRCTIHIVDNGTYADGDLHVNLPERSSLVIEATSGMRPIIMGNLAVQSVRSSGHLLLHGLLIEGKLTINNSLNLEIAHCTLMSHGLEAPYQATDLAPLQVTIDHSIVGPIHLHSHKSELSIRDSIVDCAAGEAIHTTQAAHALHSVASLERVTIFGRVELQELRVAQDVIFTAPVLVKNRRAGLVGFSYVPAHSETPPRESCVSDVEVEQQGSSSNHANEIRGEQPVYPLFTSSQYGDPGYAQLDIRGAEPILRGASNGAEMGVFSPLLQPQRRDNIAAALDEYLPAGLSAGVFYVT